MKIVLGALVIVLAILQYACWFSDGGMRTVWHLKKDIAQQNKINTMMTQKNNKLAGDIQSLKHSTAVIESRARNELGMIKKGEVFYRVVK